MKLSGYGLLFRGVHQVVQGTALGVAATFGIVETAPLDAPEPAMLQPLPQLPLRVGSVSVSAATGVSGPPPDPARASEAIKTQQASHGNPLEPPLLYDTPSPTSGEWAALPPAFGGLVERARADGAPATMERLDSLPTPAERSVALPLAASAVSGPMLDAPQLAPAAADLPFFIGMEATDFPAPALTILTDLPLDHAATSDLPEPVGGVVLTIAASFPAFAPDVSAASWIGDPGAKRQVLLGHPGLERPGADPGADPWAAAPSEKPAASTLAAAPGRGPMSTAPDRDGDEPASDALSPDLDVGADGTAADGQAKERDLLSLETLSRGGLALSGGYSSVEGPIGSVKVSRTNIGAPGRDISASARYSKVQMLLELGLSDANFMGSKMTLAPTLFYSRSSAVGFDEKINSSVFRHRAEGINLYLGKPLDRGFRIAANYRFSDEDFFIRQNNAVCDIGLHGNSFCNAIGPSKNSVFSLSLSLDRRDSAVDPTRGFQLRVTQDIAGPGGTTRYIRLRAGGTFHRRLSGNIDVSLGLEGGYMKGFDGRDVPLFDRFYIGGNSMRGFDLRGLGPKVIPTTAAPGQTTAIGGRAYYVGRFEVAMRLGGRMDKFGVSPSVFVDAGSVFGAQKSELLPGEILLGNSAKPRVAVGVGLSFNVAPGKLRFNIARPVLRQQGDRGRTFSVTFGTAF